MTVQTFDDQFSALLRASALPPHTLRPGECRSATGRACPLCYAVSLDYATELDFKNRALREFTQLHHLQVQFESIVASPLGRAYRSVTKRRVFRRGEQLRLGLIDQSEGGGIRPFEPVLCAIEPEAHGAMYRHVQEAVADPRLIAVTEELSYVIIKEGDEGHIVILNVRRISSRIVHAANMLSKSLTRHCDGVIGVFLYRDTSGGRYYMGSEQESSRVMVRKVFGRDQIVQHVLGKKFLYPPVSFSQVNRSIVPALVSAAGASLDLRPGATLFDLYCGYGLFALCLGSSAARVVGMDVSASSIEAATRNAQHQHVSNMRFIRGAIEAGSIADLMRHSAPRDAVLLDPPRGGTAPGVIECIAARLPSQVLHLFCTIDLMPAELDRWAGAGYRAEKAIPFDMFPGTSSVEVMLLLVRG